MRAEADIERSEARRPVCLRRAGWWMLAAGAALPWIHRVGPLGDEAHRWPLEVLGETASALMRGLVASELGAAWWWSLPLVYLLVLPALCWGRTSPETPSRSWGTRAWVLGVGGALAWVVTVGSPPEVYRALWRLCPGFLVTATGALLVGLAPVMELPGLRARLARWRGRRGTDVAERALCAHTLQRLPASLVRLVGDAHRLRTALSPHRPLDAGASLLLSDIVVQLRTLDGVGRAEFADHGHDSDHVLERLAPVEPRRESTLCEALRVDGALMDIESLGLHREGSAPYR